jgi:hypothetical protein
MCAWIILKNYMQTLNALLPLLHAGMVLLGRTCMRKMRRNKVR